MSIPIDPRFIPAFSIEDVLLNKDDGQPLTGGLVYFEHDNQRGVLKPVYQITGTSPNYTFIELPNPVELSSIGTFEDSLGNPTIPYFYPYDAEGEVDLYYIRVTSSSDVPQFTREAQPYISTNSTDGTNGTFDNQISNPQFAEVLFQAPTKIYSYNAASLEVTQIAPGWEIVVSSSAAATVTVTQLAPAGTLNRITNPGTLIQISSTGVSRLRLRQRFYGSPNIWGSANIAASFVAKTYSGTVVQLAMYYSQSNGSVSDVQVVNAQLLASGEYDTYSGSVAIPASTSTQFYPDAYVDIEFNLPLNIQVDITSVMLIPTGTEVISSLGYQQDSNDRQVDYLFHYYKDQLIQKPISSFLQGWDFPLNPAQALGATVAASAIGANKSKYVWDQTIVFQSANSGVGVTRGTGGEIVLTAAATTQVALIQYQDQIKAREILNNRISVHLAAKSTTASTNGIKVAISLWYTTDVTLPVVTAGTNNSIVLTLDANGKPATQNGTWAEVPRVDYPDAVVTVKSNATTGFNDYSFNGWDLEGIPATNTATYFAIVIGTESIASADTLSVYSVGLCAGDIATRPAPQSKDEVLRECEYYYETTYPLTSVPPAATFAGAHSAPMTTNLTTSSITIYPNGFGAQFNVIKRATTPLVSLYSGTSTTANRVEAYSGGTVGTAQAEVNVGTFWASIGASSKGFYVLPATSGGALLSGVSTTGANEGYGFILYHYIADARLGIVT